MRRCFGFINKKKKKKFCKKISCSDTKQCVHKTLLNRLNGIPKSHWGEKSRMLPKVTWDDYNGLSPVQKAILRERINR